MNDEQLCAVYQRVVAERTSGARELCVTPERLMALVAREGDETERLATLDHVMACRHCLREFELLRSVGSAAAQPSRRVSWGVGLAAAAGLLLLLGLYTTRGLWRADAGPDIERGARSEVRLVAPTGKVAGRGLVLTWRAAPDAARYEVELLDAEGTPEFTAATRDTSVALPPATVLTSGAEYRWWVRAILNDGSQWRSVPETLRVAR